jgi:cation diffusion facilitator CzcD-associated flavoprotein CzcO
MGKPRRAAFSLRDLLDIHLHPPMATANPSSDTHIHTVIVVGAGFAGVGAAIALRKAGIDFLMLEKASEPGGVWRDNTYPDCACDIPSSFYSYSFAPNPRWSRMFARQEEIKAYCGDTVSRFGLLPHLRLNCEMHKAHWNEAEKLWQLDTSLGLLRARFVVMACGPMHVPLTPDIPGLESFTGTHFHSARWRHDLDLVDKRVAVVGSGASAIQFVPAIAPQVAQLTLFQRTAPWVLAKMDLHITEQWQSRFARFPWLQNLLRRALYLQFELLNYSLKFPRAIGRLQVAGLKNIARGIKDSDLRQKVTPNFSLGCKRILQSNTWYKTLAQPKVQVFSGIARIEGNTLVSSKGESCEADVIIWGTGFEVAEPPVAQVIFGKSGQALSTHWKGSASAYLGTMLGDCPNLFMMCGPNLYAFSSAFVMIEAQVKFILAAIRSTEAKPHASISVTPSAHQGYNQAVQLALKKTVWNSGCSSYFIDRNGNNSTNWPWTTWYMRWRLARLRPGDFTED